MNAPPVADAILDRLKALIELRTSLKPLAVRAQEGYMHDGDEKIDFIIKLPKDIKIEHIPREDIRALSTLIFEFNSAENINKFPFVRFEY